MTFLPLLINFKLTSFLLLNLMIISHLLCVHRIKWSNKLGVLGCVVRTYFYMVWKWSLIGGVCLQWLLLARIRVRRLKVGVYIARSSHDVCNRNGPLCSSFCVHEESKP